MFLNPNLAIIKSSFSKLSSNIYYIIFSYDLSLKWKILLARQYSHFLYLCNQKPLRNLCNSVHKGFHFMPVCFTLNYTITFQPQNNIPDVIIWMLCGNERTAYYRIPASEIMFSSNLECRGELCSKLQTITLKVVLI